MLISEYDKNIEQEKALVLLEAKKTLTTPYLSVSDLDTIKLHSLNKLNDKLNICEFVGDESEFWDFCDRHILDMSIKLDELLPSLSKSVSP